MTIKDYVTDLQKTGNTAFADKMMNTVNIWSNAACKGYCTAAMKKAGFSREQIASVLEELTAAFEEIAVEDAEKINGR